MAFAPPKIAEGPKLQLKLSTWTPLSHQAMNDKVFEERRALLGKWFDKWTDGQRRRILVELLERCSLSQQKFCAKHLQARVPTEAIDFTTRLPRVLSLYIFSFLDPRSLCRCAQVSWPWKQLAELDQLWMLKCLRFGWKLNFCPTPFEQGVWKKLYIEMVRELRLSRPKPPSKAEFIVIDVQPLPNEVPERKSPAAAQGKARGQKDLPPWRSPDRNPRDTIRFNFLDNCDCGQQAWQARRKGGGHTPDLSRQAAERKKRGGRGCRQPRKVKSLVSLSADPECVPKPPARPRWATAEPRGALSPKVTSQALGRSCRWNTAVRPGPARAPEARDTGAGDGPGTVPRSPSPPPFEARPWHIPSSNQGSDTE